MLGKHEAGALGMSVHLVGGGWDGASSHQVYGRFLSEAVARSDGSARVVVLLVVEQPGSQEANTFVDRVCSVVGTTASVELDMSVIAEGERFSADVLARADGILVGGGRTPAYRDAVKTIEGELRRLVAGGLPYLGYSAGAAIASEHALIGGWRIGDVPVGSPDIAEGLEDVTVAQGIGIVDLTVEAHAAQWGTLARLIAATEAGIVDGGLAIDENTVLVVAEGGLVVDGIGSVWSVRAGDGGVFVRTLAS